MGSLWWQEGRWPGLRGCSSSSSNIKIKTHIKTWVLGMGLLVAPGHGSILIRVFFSLLVLFFLALIEKLLKTVRTFYNILRICCCYCCKANSPRKLNNFWFMYCKSKSCLHILQFYIFLYVHQDFSKATKFEPFTKK